MNIYKDIILSDTTYQKTFIRTFKHNTDLLSLVWHRDYNDRTIEVLNLSDGWYFQFDNEKPIYLEKNTKLDVSGFVYHRLIKDEYTSDLVLKIIEYKN